MFEQQELCSLIIKVFKFRVNFVKNEQKRTRQKNAANDMGKLPLCLTDSDKNLDFFQ